MWLDCQSASKKNGMILIVRSLVFDNFHTLSADLDIELCLESDLDSQKLDIEGESTLDSSQSSISVNRLDIGPISRLDGLLCGRTILLGTVEHVSVGPMEAGERRRESGRSHVENRKKGIEHFIA